MPFAPDVGDKLEIDGTSYQIAEHPGAPRMPFGQQGREAIVYQLVSGRGPKALKVFRPAFVRTESVQLAAQLQQFARLPGLTVCDRRVLTASQHAALLQQHDDLKYAALMPWIEGPTWQEVLLQHAQSQPLDTGLALRIARALGTVLVRMEEAGVAHCDLSAPNVMLPMLEGQPQSGHGVELIDVESLYSRGIPRPDKLPAGSAGYGHRTVRNGMWSAEADRFAGAVLLAEVLALSDPQAFGLLRLQPESYFRDADLQVDGPAYQAVWSALHRWDGSVADLFYRAWISRDLRECPTFSEWHLALGRLVAPTRPAVEVPPATEPYDPAKARQPEPSRTPAPNPPSDNRSKWVLAAGVILALLMGGGGAAIAGTYLFNSAPPTAAPLPTPIVIGGDTIGSPTPPPPIDEKLADSVNGVTAAEGNSYWSATLPPSQLVTLRLDVADCSDAVDFSISFGPNTLNQETVGSQKVDECTQSLSFSTGEGGPATITVGNKTDGPTSLPREYTLTSEGFEINQP